MNAPPDTYDINALAQATGLSLRTIRYYLAEGLLPPPVGRGSAATYGPGHRDRLRLLRRLQDAHLPLAAIRAHLEALDDAGVAAALNAAAAPTAAPSLSARDYIRRVLDQSAQPPLAVAEPEPRLASRQRGAPTRSTWERIALHPDLELHVRRPLARADQRRLDALLQHAERLFGTAAGTDPP